MTIPLPPGQAPYITAPMLLSGQWPTGVSFASLPPGRDVSPTANFDAVTNVAAEATSECDAYCNLPLRATLVTESFHGPGDGAMRVSVQTGSGLGRIVLQRLPILAVLNVQVSPNTFPRQWTTVPSGQYGPEYPALGPYGSQAASAAGQGGQAIVISQGYISWCAGRNGIAIQVTYIHGWPHTSLTGGASKGDSTIEVDDCTAWAPLTAGGPGAAGTVYDTVTAQEALNVASSSVTAGPGTLTLTAPLAYDHAAGTMVSSFPQNIIWGAALFAAAAALNRGATATVVQTAPGGGSEGHGPEDKANEAEVKLHPYRRVI